MNKHDPIYSLACGTAPITFVERDGACSVFTGNTTTGTVAAPFTYLDLRVKQ